MGVYSGSSRRRRRTRAAGQGGREDLVVDVPQILLDSHHPPTNRIAQQALESGGSGDAGQCLGCGPGSMAEVLDRQFIERIRGEYKYTSVGAVG